MQYNTTHKYTTKNITLVLLLSFFTIFNVLGQKKYMVVLDAGHGGKDSGASSSGRIEKKIALSVVLKAGKILEKKSNIKVVYTRKSDVFIELHKRAKMANELEADLFISVHCNANRKSDPHGSETYVLGLNGNSANMSIAQKENEVILLENDYKKNYDYDPNSPESLIGLSVLQEENLDASLAFAGMTQKNFSNSKRIDRSVQQANFLVLRETVMPSVLIELGFLTNRKEGNYLNSRRGQTAMAKAIAKAVKSYIGQLEKNTVALSSSKKKEKFSANKVIYKVQIASSKRFIANDTTRFQGLRSVKIEKIEGRYCYFYGVTNSYKGILNYLDEVSRVGVKGAFVVAFEKGRRLPLNEAREKTGE